MSFTRSVVVLLSLLVARTAAADIAATDATGKPLPAQLKPRGAKIERVQTFTDKLGTNYVVFSSTDSQKKENPDDGGMVARTRWLFIDHWAIATGKQPKSLLPARDFEKDCPLDLVAEFVPAAFGVTDLDADGLAEVTYGYQLACRGDVSPAAYKLLLVENGKKHILRGTARIEVGDPMGGEFKPEPAVAKWPKAFYERATTVWKATAADVGIK